MRISVFGAGAIGAMLAVAAHANGHEVELVLRGPHLEAVRAEGLRVRFDDGERHARLAADARPRAGFDPALVVVATKAVAHEAAVAAYEGALAPDAAMLFVANGLPWWHDPGTAALLDPRHRLRDAAQGRPVVGGVMNGSSTVVLPGVVAVSTPRNRLALGPADARSADAARLARDALDGGVPGFAVACLDDLRPAVWGKLAANMATALPAVLSGRDLAALLATPGAGGLARALYREARAIAAAEGHATPDDEDAFLARIARSSHRPSMLQDDDLGRPMEVATMFEAPLRIARERGVPTPALDLMVPLLVARAARARDAT